MPCASFPLLCFAVLGCALAVLSKPFRRTSLLCLCGSFSGSASRLRRGVFQRSADHIRGRLCFSWAVRCFALLFHDGACRCLCFAIIAINASPSLRGEMPYLCVANPATLSLCLQCFSLTARYIAILSLLHVLLYLTQQVHSHAFQGHAFALSARIFTRRLVASPWRRLFKLFRGGAYLRVPLPARVSPW